jgi:uncharacterized protein YprB with RNaseH-like and TPR domain
LSAATSLQARLARLAPSRAPAVAAPAAWPGLADLLARLERLRTRGHPAPARSLPSLAARLGGVEVADGVIEVERSLPLWRRQGRIALARLACVGHAQAARVGAACGPADLLFLDTETTGLAGGTGTVAFVIGLGFLSGEHFVLRQFLLARPGAEAAMLARLAAAVKPQAELVTYNGKSFDLPLLATRFRLAHLPDPFAGRAHADLLHAVRRTLRGQMPNFRLGTVEESLLCYRRADDLPGSEAPAAWRALLRESRWEPLAGVLRHNRDDLVSLAALHVWLAGAPSASAGLF